MGSGNREYLVEPVEDEKRRCRRNNDGVNPITNGRFVSPVDTLSARVNPAEDIAGRPRNKASCNHGPQKQSYKVGSGWTPYDSYHDRWKDCRGHAPEESVGTAQRSFVWQHKSRHDGFLAIEVGTPVARRPPRRSRRAELPHRAPRMDAQPVGCRSLVLVFGSDHAGCRAGCNAGVGRVSTTPGFLPVPRRR